MSEVNDTAIPIKKSGIRSTAFPMIYAAALPTLRETAMEHGYALAVHGSMQRDLDLIACPWVPDASDAETLVNALKESIGGFIGDERHWDHNPCHKPHGRLAWSIHCQETPHGPYLDVSVMPRAQDWETKE